MMKSILFLLVVAVCYSAAVSENAKVERSYSTSSSTPTDFIPLNQCKKRQGFRASLYHFKEFTFSTEANPTKFYLTASNKTDIKRNIFNTNIIEISPENKKYAVSSSKSEDYTFYAHPEVFFINKTNIVSVEISQYIAEDGTEMYHGGQLIIRVNNGVANYKVHDFSQPENLDYISFVATNDGKRDEFFYIE